MKQQPQSLCLCLQQHGGHRTPLRWHSISDAYDTNLLHQFYLYLLSMTRYKIGNVFNIGNSKYRLGWVPLVEPSIWHFATLLLSDGIFIS